MSEENALVRLPATGQFPLVKLIEPTAHGYVIAAFEIDHRPPVGLIFESRKKRAAIGKLKAAAAALQTEAGVAEATVFKAVLQPPGRGALLERRPQVPVAKFDLVILVETETPEIARALAAKSPLVDAIEVVKRDATRTMLTVLRNERRIGPVDHNRDGIFLFNFFYADRLGQNLAVWEYTAGWFSDQTGLDNSTLLVPQDGQSCPYTVINHCRWTDLATSCPRCCSSQASAPMC